MSIRRNKDDFSQSRFNRYGVHNRAQFVCSCKIDHFGDTVIEFFRRSPDFVKNLCLFLLRERLRIISDDLEFTSIIFNKNRFIVRIDINIKRLLRQCFQPIKNGGRNTD